MKADRDKSTKAMQQIWSRSRIESEENPKSNYSDKQKAILFGYNLSLVISCRYSENSAHLIPFFFFLLPRIIIKEIKLSGTVVFLDL